MKAATDGGYSAGKNDGEMVAMKAGSLPGVWCYMKRRKGVFSGARMVYDHGCQVNRE